MKARRLPFFLVTLFIALGLVCENAAAENAAASGATSVLKWKDGKKAVVLLMFDDSAPSAMKTVIPELKKRGMTGTFYVVPGGGPFKAAPRDPGVVAARMMTNRDA